MARRISLFLIAAGLLFTWMLLLPEPGEATMHRAAARSATDACEVVGRLLGGQGVSLEETLADLRTTYSLVLGTEIFYFHDAWYRGLIGRVLVLDHRQLAPREAGPTKIPGATSFHTGSPRRLRICHYPDLYSSMGGGFNDFGNFSAYSIAH